MKIARLQFRLCAHMLKNPRTNGVDSPFRQPRQMQIQLRPQLRQIGRTVIGIAMIGTPSVRR